MTREEFQQLTQKPVLLDGATGSCLLSSGMPRGIPTEAWVMEHKEVIQDLQTSYLKAGTQILYAPTFGANRGALSLHGLEGEWERFNRTLLGYAQEIAPEGAYVAGDLSTTGKASGKEFPYEEAFHIYQEQIGLLAECGADLLVAETMIHVDEALAAIDAAASVCDLPILCSMTVEADGSIFFGGNIFEAAPMLESAGASAVGINCSVGPDQLESIVRRLSEILTVPVIAKPNAGMPVITPDGEAVYSMDAPTFARHMKVLVDAGATLVGGCCGTTPEYIAELKKLL